MVILTLNGTYNRLLWVTSPSKDDADFYRRQLQRYRWAVKVSRKSANLLEIASSILTAR